MRNWHSNDTRGYGDRTVLCTPEIKENKRLARVIQLTLYVFVLSNFLTFSRPSWAGLTLFDSCQQVLLSVKPKLGLASSKHQNFDVRVVSQWGGRSQWSNRTLNDSAVSAITEAKNAIQRLGLNSDHYLNVLVEKHPGAISCPTQELGTCLAVGPFGLITTPNILGFRSLFFGSSRRQDTFESMPRTLVLKALTTDCHSLFSPFTIAHELVGHDTEPYGSPNSLMWKEARADFLAYASTGLAEISWPAEIEAMVFDDEGRILTTQEITKRSLVNPKVASKVDLIANRYAYHENSELISSLLFRFAKAFGLNVAVDFIKWIDSLESSRILDLERETSLRPRGNDSMIEHGPQIKQAWIAVVDSFFKAFSEWSTSQNKDQKIRDWISAEKNRIDRL